MQILDDAQALTIKNLPTKILINDTCLVAQLEEAIGWFSER